MITQAHNHNYILSRVGWHDFTVNSLETDDAAVHLGQDGPNSMAHSKHKLPGRGDLRAHKKSGLWKKHGFHHSAKVIWQSDFPPFFSSPCEFLKKGDISHMRERTGWGKNLSTSVSPTFPVHNKHHIKPDMAYARTNHVAYQFLRMTSIMIM